MFITETALDRSIGADRLGCRWWLWSVWGTIMWPPGWSNWGALWWSKWWILWWSKWGSVLWSEWGSLLKTVHGGPSGCIRCFVDSQLRVAFYSKEAIHLPKVIPSVR